MRCPIVIKIRHVFTQPRPGADLDGYVFCYLGIWCARIFLERRLVRAAKASSARVIVELGPGTGGTTRALLAAMRTDAQLLAIEINPGFAAFLERSPDPRLRVHLGSAAEVRQALSEHGLERPQAVLSGIPFSTLARETRRATLEAARRVLTPGGHFVAYQVRSHVRRFAEPVFGRGETHREFLNLPPMRIYVWQRPLDDA